MNNNTEQLDEDPRDPATRAFDTLREELATVRQSVESLGASIQQSRPYDYRKTLGQILRTQESVETELEAIKSHPAIRLTPDGFAQQLEKAKNELLKAQQCCFLNQAYSYRYFGEMSQIFRLTYSQIGRF